MPVRLFLLVVLLVLTGCRESLLGPETEEELPAMPGEPAMEGFLKGPEQLSLDEQGRFKAQIAPGATVYRWYQTGEGRLALSYTGDRFLSASALRPGAILLEYVAFDADQSPVLRGHLRLEATP